MVFELPEEFLKYEIQQQDLHLMTAIMSNKKILQFSDLEYGILEISDEMETYLSENRSKYSSDHSNGIFEVIRFQNKEESLLFKLRFGGE